jgi:hypothetical protein
MEQNPNTAWDSVPLLSLGKVPEEIIENDCQKYRAIIVKRAFKATYEEIDDPEQCITDMLADLRHLSDFLGLDFGKIDRVAYNRYLEEKNGAPRSAPPSSEENLETCRFIPFSKVRPETWISWFESDICEDSAFGWGTNNRTMVSASSLLEEWKPKLLRIREEELAEGHVQPEEIDAFIETMENLGDTYIDLEN